MPNSSSTWRPVSTRQPVRLGQVADAARTRPAPRAAEEQRASPRLAAPGRAGS
jgi:hypothetical protein